MSSDQTPKVALVTGGAIRVGRSIVIGLHNQGFNVMIHCNTSVKEAQDLVDELNQQRPASVQYVSYDLSINVEETCNSLIEACLVKWGRLDVLVNNAANFKNDSLEEITTQAWQIVMNTNVMAPAFLMKAAAKYLKITKGSIINIGDLIGEQQLPTHFIHSASKAALICASKSATLSLAPEVRVNLITPGCVAWPIKKHNDPQDDSAKENYKNSTPLKRFGTPEDVSEAVNFLVSSKAKFITGANLHLDGGIGLCGSNNFDFGDKDH